jgi:hypothetical protein
MPGNLNVQSFSFALFRIGVIFGFAVLNHFAFTGFLALGFTKVRMPERFIGFPGFLNVLFQMLMQTLSSLCNHPIA